MRKPIKPRKPSKPKEPSRIKIALLRMESLLEESFTPNNLVAKIKKEALESGRAIGYDFNRVDWGEVKIQICYDFGGSRGYDYFKGYVDIDVEIPYPDPNYGKNLEKYQQALSIYEGKMQKYQLEMEEYHKHLETWRAVKHSQKLSEMEKEKEILEEKLNQLILQMENYKEER